MTHALVLGLALVSAGAAPASREPLELRLLRTIYTGVWQQAEAADALRHASDSHQDFLGHMLARAALAVTGQDQGFPEWPMERVLDRALDLLSGPSHAFQTPRGMAAGFEGPQAAFAAVHALVTTGQAEKAEAVLERHLTSGARFKRAVVLQALRNIGDARSTALIQRFAEVGDDHNLAENLLADQRFPFLHELAARLSRIPPAERTRERLLSATAEGCGERSALAVYFLGYFPPSDDPWQEQREEAALQALARASCFQARYFAVRTLALRAPRTAEYWTGLFQAEDDAWQRAQLARIGFGRFGGRFLAPALELLAREPSQYVQWELMHGNLEVREAARFRTYWDIWEAPTLQFHLNFPRDGGSMSERDADELLRWLESGARPRDEWVRNHLLHGLARHLSGPLTRRFLRVFDAIPERSRHFWILSPLPDLQALPLLRYWLAQPITEEAQHKALEDLVESLEARTPSRGAAGACCLPTPDCLRSRLRSASVAPSAITTADEARRWLEAAEPGQPVPRLRFLDPLERVAVARWPDCREQRGEHLYGCWRRIDQAASVTR